MLRNNLNFGLSEIVEETLLKIPIILKKDRFFKFSARLLPVQVIFGSYSLYSPMKAPYMEGPSIQVRTIIVIYAEMRGSVNSVRPNPLDLLSIQRAALLRTFCLLIVVLFSLIRWPYPRASRYGWRGDPDSPECT